MEFESVDVLGTVVVALLLMMLTDGWRFSLGFVCIVDMTCAMLDLWLASCCANVMIGVILGHGI